MTELRYTDRAIADLEEILLFLVDRAGETVALALEDSIRQTGLTLCNVPRAAGTPVPHLRADLRRHPYQRYNLYFTYDVGEDVLYLLRVLHSARDVTPDMFI